MNQKFISVALLIAGLILLGWNVVRGIALAAEETLVCHGGGNMRVELWHRGMKLYFDRAEVAASTRMPAPGECAWADRPFRRGEPALLSYTSTRLDDVTVHFGADGVITAFAVHGSHGAPDVLRTLLDGVRGKKEFRVKAGHARCNGAPCPYLTVRAK